MHKKSERSSYTKLWGISQLCFSQNPEGRAGEVEEKPVFRSVLRPRCLFHCQFLTQVRPDLWLTFLGALATMGRRPRHAAQMGTAA